MGGILVIGAGQAGYQAAVALREGGYDGPVTLIGAEAELPYQRPPLSKAFLETEDCADTVALRPAAFFERRNITLRLGSRALSIDRPSRRVRLDDGSIEAYDHLILATGADNRTPGLRGAGLDGVMSVRHVGDALALRAALREARNIVVVGGGFLGLEVACTARKAGKSVHVLEAGSRLMARGTTPFLSDWFLDHHRAGGITVDIDTAPIAIAGRRRAEFVATGDGRELPADLVVTAIGVTPNTSLAEMAELHTDRGIVVDNTLRTSDPHIFAIGDCASFPGWRAAGHIRIESVQNACDQARCAAANILGRTTRYDAVPIFWSDQGARLQIAGLPDLVEETVNVGSGDRFSVYGFRQGRLVAVESVNRPIDHARARRSLAAPTVVTIDQFIRQGELT